MIAAAPIVRADTPAPPPPPSPAPVEAGPEEALDKKIAVWRFDALGIDPELVSRLEALFRAELGRLDKVPLISRRDLERLAGPELATCAGEERCLAAIGKKAGVAVVVTGTVATLGDNYVLDIKAVDVASGKALERTQSDPLRGSPDDLIESVRVAAYKLLAPDQLHGAVQIQSDLIGAEVKLDGKDLGKTPLPGGGVVLKQPLGKHRLHVEMSGYSPFDDDVDVHFQKVSPVIVRLLPSTEVIGTGKTVVVERRPIYTRTWFLVGVGVVAVGLGIVIGHRSGGANECTVQPNGGCI
jgi:TolB-like protein